jgi:hypothetical protein
MFKNKKRLISFGCSHTEAVAMPDNNYRGAGPSKYSWSNVIAQHYGLKHDNQGWAGASNRAILYRILNYDYDRYDIVFILWSHTDRHTKFYSNKCHHIGPWTIKQHNKKDPKVRRIAKYWLQFMQDNYDSLLDTSQCMHHAKLYLDSLSIKSFHMMQTKTGDMSYKGMEHTNDIKYLLRFRLQNVFFDQHRRIPPLALDDSHAGVNAHKSFADAVIESIKTNNTISIKDII